MAQTSQRFYICRWKTCSTNHRTHTDILLQCDICRKVSKMLQWVLGDEIATIEKHYSELIPSKSQKVALTKRSNGNTISSEETVQPKWLKRQIEL